MMIFDEYFNKTEIFNYLYIFFLYPEKVCFNEPPRRVLVPVGSLYLCDYLFPGEAPAEALLSVKELLDLQITEGDVVCDIETPAGI